MRVSGLTWCAGLAVLTVSTGCGSAPNQSGGSVPTPATSQLQVRSFAVEVPPGWRDATAESADVARIQRSGKMELLLEAPVSSSTLIAGGVRGTISVTVVPDGPIPSAEVVPYLSNVTRAGATAVSPPVPVSLDGAPGTAISYTSDIAGTPGRNDDIVVTRDGMSYEITLSTSAGDFPLHNADLARLLHSWHWLPKSSGSPR